MFKVLSAIATSWAVLGKIGYFYSNFWSHCTQFKSTVIGSYPGFDSQSSGNRNWSELRYSKPTKKTFC